MTTEGIRIAMRLTLTRAADSVQIVRVPAAALDRVIGCGTTTTVRTAEDMVRQTGAHLTKHLLAGHSLQYGLFTLMGVLQMLVRKRATTRSLTRIAARVELLDLHQCAVATAPAGLARAPAIVAIADLGLMFVPALRRMVSVSIATVEVTGTIIIIIIMISVYSDLAVDQGHVAVTTDIAQSERGILGLDLVRVTAIVMHSMVRIAMTRSRDLIKNMAP